jgi:hypothetical protein
MSIKRYELGQHGMLLSAPCTGVINGLQGTAPSSLGQSTSQPVAAIPYLFNGFLGLASDVSVSAVDNSYNTAGALNWTNPPAPQLPLGPGSIVNVSIYNNAANNGTKVVVSATPTKLIVQSALVTEAAGAPVTFVAAARVLTAKDCLVIEHLSSNFKDSLNTTKLQLLHSNLRITDPVRASAIRQYGTGALQGVVLHPAGVTVPVQGEGEPVFFGTDFLGLNLIGNALTVEANFTLANTDTVQRNTLWQIVLGLNVYVEQ